MSVPIELSSTQCDVGPVSVSIELSSTQCGIGPVCVPIELSSTQCGIGPVCVPIELSSTQCGIGPVCVCVFVCVFFSFFFFQENYKRNLQNATKNFFAIVCAHFQVDMNNSILFKADNDMNTSAISPTPSKGQSNTFLLLTC